MSGVEASQKECAGMRWIDFGENFAYYREGFLIGEVLVFDF